MSSSATCGGAHPVALPAPSPHTAAAAGGAASAPAATPTVVRTNETTTLSPARSAAHAPDPSRCASAAARRSVGRTAEAARSPHDPDTAAGADPGSCRNAVPPAAPGTTIAAGPSSRTGAPPAPPVSAMARMRPPPIDARMPACASDPDTRMTPSAGIPPATAAPGGSTTVASKASRVTGPSAGSGRPPSGKRSSDAPRAVEATIALAYIPGVAGTGALPSVVAVARPGVTYTGSPVPAPGLPARSSNDAGLIASEPCALRGTGGEPSATWSSR